ncbi:MAG: maleylacetoacetate isomerase [Candidimonas sp.]|nr:MAG: maleylacetoacetate isomerase [Candidimonas sp.]TAM22573.1 MAG: maleylacetoacetate isomerase [Candidimonas sp.]TAM75941.1 MAG: maleylacetoacetate isomerase [Candidimonas sp.]
MQLYSFFNSSTSYRVRIALALKHVEFECLPVNIRVQEHKTADYIGRNPGAGVPLLVDGDFNLGQSLAIIDYLDSRYPKPLLIPQELRSRARVLEIANLIACDMHPVNNLKVLRYLVKTLGVSEEQKNAWYQHWINEGLRSLEALLQRAGSGLFCLGEEPTLADCCLVPQVANALRMKCRVDEFTRVMAVYEHCNTLPPFQQAAPAQQPDFSA